MPGGSSEIASNNELTGSGGMSSMALEYGVQFVRYKRFLEVKLLSSTSALSQAFQSASGGGSCTIVLGTRFQ